jgi:hypothetical protein
VCITVVLGPLKLALAQDLWVCCLFHELQIRILLEVSLVQVQFHIGIVHFVEQMQLTSLAVGRVQDTQTLPGLNGQ